MARSALLGLLVAATACCGGAGCALQRAPIVDRRVDGGGLDAPVAPVDAGQGDDVPAQLPDVPMELPDVPMAPDVPVLGCVPECSPGQVCDGGSCVCDATECAGVGGECADDCRPCGSLGAACCTTREPCAGGASCAPGGVCEIMSDCGGLGEPCCGGRSCSDSSSICLAGLCQMDPGSCGGADEACCPGNQCGDRTSCRRTVFDVRRLCRGCGGSFEPCCPVGPACTSGAACLLGGCS